MDKQISLKRRIKRLQKLGVTISPEQLVTIQEKLDAGICEICGKKRLFSQLCIDHNHKTREIRGVLCKRCNYMLGTLHDNAELLRSMSDYLIRTNTQV